MTSPPPSSSGPFGLPRVVFWGGVVIILLLVSFVVGYVVGVRRIGDLTRRMEQAEARVDAVEARRHAYEALSLLYRTLLDVDARNFGIANQRLDSATAVLGRVNPVALGADAATLETLRSDLVQLDVRVASDLARQRTTLSHLAQRLAEVLGT